MSVRRLVTAATNGRRVEVRPGGPRTLVAVAACILTLAACGGAAAASDAAPPLAGRAAAERSATTAASVASGKRAAADPKCAGTKRDTGKAFCLTGAAAKEAGLPARLLRATRSHGDTVCTHPRAADADAADGESSTRVVDGAIAATSLGDGVTGCPRG